MCVLTMVLTKQVKFYIRMYIELFNDDIRRSSLTHCYINDTMILMFFAGCNHQDSNILSSDIETQLFVLFSTSSSK